MFSIKGSTKEGLKGLNVTVMGLGLNGGGLESALFLSRAGARVTVTDLRDEKILAPSMERLKGCAVTYVLGRHEESDFADTDLVIKNPGVPQDSPFLKLAREKRVPIETDLSLFLHFIKNPVIAVTGSKGKSTTASAIYFCLRDHDPTARIGGNITVSPLSFIDEIAPGAPLVLELSSWQLADLAGKGVLKPKVSLITNLLPDHMNRYGGMEDYLEDKKQIFADQGPEDYSLFNGDDPWLKGLPAQSRARSLLFKAAPQAPGFAGAYLQDGKGYASLDGRTELILDKMELQGEFNRLNLLAAGLALYAFGMDPAKIRGTLARFKGIEHRLEKFLTNNGITYYNDSAATIPQATVWALKSLREPVSLITGGTDKNIDFEPFLEAASIPKAIYLLAGTGTDKLRPILERAGVRYKGPYTELEPAVRDAMSGAQPGSAVLLSPGCASFGMFLNEFDRGNKFKQAVLKLVETV
jgi:UDP-N-acetylmuramoylalanine--D-glutamate ligase